MDPVMLILIVPAAIIVFIFMLGLTQWLWNSTLPRVFGCREITMWETFKIGLLAGILFSGANLPFGYSWSSTTPGGGNVSFTIGSVK